MANGMKHHVGQWLTVSLGVKSSPYPGGKRHVSEVGGECGVRMVGSESPIVAFVELCLIRRRSARRGEISPGCGHIAHNVDASAAVKHSPLYHSWKTEGNDI